MTTLIRTATPAELLAMVPALVGMETPNSIVLVGFAGKRTHATLRFDLPTSESSVVLKRAVTTIVGTFCKIRGRVDGVVPVVRTDDGFGSHSGLIDTLIRRLEQSGFEVKDALCHAATGWGSYFDTRAPAGGYPLADIEVAAARHRELLPTDEALLPESDDLARQRMRRDYARVNALLASFDSPFDRLADPEHDWPDDMEEDDDYGEDDDLYVAPDHELAPLADLPYLAEQALGWEPAAIDQQGALLLRALQAPPMRDLVMVQWASELAVGDAMFHPDSCMGMEAVRWHPDVSRSVSDVMIGRGPRPDPDRITRGIALLRVLVSRADDPLRPAPLCMLAWLSWALGRGTAAGGYLDMARSIDPGYSMAELLDSVVSNGMVPEWAFGTPDLGASESGTSESGTSGFGSSDSGTARRCED